MEDAIHQYERASVVRLNPQKSKALAVGSWSTSETVLGIDYHPYFKILSVTFWGTIGQSMKESWARLKDKVYARDLYLAHRVRYVHTFLLAKIQYSA